MPNLDGTGPTSAGSSTGRGMGPCGAGMGSRRGFGRDLGLRRRFGFSAGRKGFAPRGMNRQEEKEMLENRAEMLEQDLKGVKERLDELKEE